MAKKVKLGVNEITVKEASTQLSFVITAVSYTHLTLPTILLV